MIKKVVGLLFLLLLVLLTVFNLLNQRDLFNSSSSNQGNKIDVTGDTSVKGTSIIAPDMDQGLGVNQLAPDFSLETLMGETLSLSDYRGQIVFLNFWATWCGPCRVEMPEMHEFQNKYPDKVKIIAVNATYTETNVKDVEEFMSHGEFSFTVVLDHDSTVSETYKLLNIPTTYLIDSEGYIKERILGPMTFDYMEAMVNSLQ